MLRELANNRRFLRLAVIALVMVAALMLAPLAFSQGCALCYTQVANSGARMIRAIQHGIVILIIPPLSMCIAAMILTFRRRNQFHEAGDRNESDW
jgi:hypothetical protein